MLPCLSSNKYEATVRGDEYVRPLCELVENVGDERRAAYDELVLFLIALLVILGSVWEQEDVDVIATKVAQDRHVEPLAGRLEERRMEQDADDQSLRLSL